MPETLRPRVLVVGGGPGGYVAAIRAGQLGLDTVLVEAGRLGGTCLIRGCIPSKALIHAADRFADMAAGGKTLGIAIDGAPRLDLARTVAWKDGIVDRLSSGVAGLLARAKVRVVEGWANFTDAKSCTVETASGPVAITAEHVILAAGSEPVALPGLPFGGECHLLDRGAVAARAAGAAGGGRRRLYRPRTRHRLQEARQRGDRGRGRRPHPAALRCGADRAGAALARPRRGRAASRGEGDRARRRGPPRGRNRDRAARARRRQDPGDGRPPAAGRGLGPRSNGARPGGAVRQGRRPVPHRDARRVGDRRSGRRADAGAQGDGAGRDGRRDHRRAAPPFRSRIGRRDRLHRARDRRRRHAAGRGCCGRHRRRRLGLSVRRQRARP